jgi:hypothetical protein
MKKYNWICPTFGRFYKETHEEQTENRDTQNMSRQFFTHEFYAWLAMWRSHSINKTVRVYSHSARCSLTSHLRKFKSSHKKRIDLTAWTTYQTLTFRYLTFYNHLGCIHGCSSNNVSERCEPVCRKYPVCVCGRPTSLPKSNVIDKWRLCEIWGSSRTSLYVGFEVLTAVSTKMAVFRVVAPCSLVEVYQRFRGPCKDQWKVG